MSDNVTVDLLARKYFDYCYKLTHGKTLDKVDTTLFVSSAYSNVRYKEIEEKFLVRLTESNYSLLDEVINRLIEIHRDANIISSASAEEEVRSIQQGSVFNINNFHLHWCTGFVTHYTKLKEESKVAHNNLYNVDSRASPFGQALWWAIREEATPIIVESGLFAAPEEISGDENIWHSKDSDTIRKLAFIYTSLRTKGFRRQDIRL